MGAWPQILAGKTADGSDRTFLAAAVERWLLWEKQLSDEG